MDVSNKDLFSPDNKVAFIYKPLLGQQVVIRHTQTKNPNGEQIAGKLVEILYNDNRRTLVLSDGHTLKFVNVENVISCLTLKEALSRGYGSF